MKIKLRVLTCTHEHRFGVDSYTYLVKKNEDPEEYIRICKENCDFNEERDSLDYGIEEVIIDTDDYDVIEESGSKSSEITEEAVGGNS